MATTFLYQQQRKVSPHYADLLTTTLFSYLLPRWCLHNQCLDGIAQERPALGAHHRHQALRPVGLGQPHQHGRAKPMEARRVFPLTVSFNNHWEGNNITDLVAPDCILLFALKFSHHSFQNENWLSNWLFKDSVHCPCSWCSKARHPKVACPQRHSSPSPPTSLLHTASRVIPWESEKLLESSQSTYLMVESFRKLLPYLLIIASNIYIVWASVNLLLILSREEE